MLNSKKWYSVNPNTSEVYNAISLSGSINTDEILLQAASEQTESLFATGNTVGDYAKQVFPGGTEIEFTFYDFATR